MAYLIALASLLNAVPKSLYGTQMPTVRLYPIRILLNPRMIL